MTGGFVCTRPRGGASRLVVEGCRRATSGPVRVALLGRLYTWERSRPDIDADLAELARRIETSGLVAALGPVD
ncbi:MAG: hypothetical protein WD673_10325, partial [Alphaproteobacteria bacterium]